MEQSEDLHFVDIEGFKQGSQVFDACGFIRGLNRGFIRLSKIPFRRVENLLGVKNSLRLFLKCFSLALVMNLNQVVQSVYHITIRLPIVEIEVLCNLGRHLSDSK